MGDNHPSALIHMCWESWLELDIGWLGLCPISHASYHGGGAQAIAIVRWAKISSVLDTSAPCFYLCSPKL